MTGEPALSLSDDEARRRLERLADRLRVVGPRLAAREGEPARELLARIRAGLQQIADLAAEADGEPRRPVPELAAHALGDQALVLGADLLGADRPGTDLLGTDRPDPTNELDGTDRTVATWSADERRIAAGRAFAEISALI